MSNKNLHLEFIDEGIRLVNAAEEQGIQLRILGSIAYRLQCPKYVHMFDAMQRVLTDVDFAGLDMRLMRAFMWPRRVPGIFTFIRKHS